MAKKTDNEQDIITKFLIKELNKGHELPVAFSLNGENPTEIKDFISTGSTILDYIISNRRNGGIPAGKITEIVGEEASGKSLLATQILANTQKKGGIAVYLDTENAANPDFMKRIGLDLNKLVYMQPGSIEECYEQVEKIIGMARAKDTKCPVTIVWDSTAATPPKAELEGDYDPNSRIGLAAKAHAKGMRKITQMVGSEKITLVLTNQLKTKIGVMFGDPMTTPGGKAIPYHASVRLRLERGKDMAEGEAKQKEVYGVHTRAKTFKNRLGPGMRKCEFDILYESGVDDLSSIRDYLWENRGVITKSGGWMNMKNHKGEDIKFRSDQWAELMQDEAFSEYVHSLLEKYLVIRYDNTEVDYTVDMHADRESVLDMEALVDSMDEK